MRYRLRTIMLVIAGLAGPIYAATEGWKAGCLPMIVMIWAVIVGAPLGLMIFMISIISNEIVKENSIAVLGAFAIIGYFLASLVSTAVIGLSGPWLR